VVPSVERREWVADRNQRPIGMGRLLTSILRVVWPSIVLGVATRLLLMVLTNIFVGQPAGSFLPELASRVIWSVVACSGVGLGTGLAKRRVAAMGIGGFAGAPLAFDLARAARKGAVELIRFEPATGAPSPIALAVVKAAEYGCLGILLGLTGRGKAPASRYALVGLATSMVFGGTILLHDALAAPPLLPTAAILDWLVNEFFFPIGCALVIFTADRRDFAGSR